MNPVSNDAPVGRNLACASGSGQVARRIVTAAALTAGMVTFAAIFGAKFWAAELLVHFRMQLTLGTLFLAGGALLLRLPGTAILAVVLAAANVAYVFPYIVPGPAAAHAGTLSMRAMVVNVSARNTNYSALHDLIDELQPDLIGLVEVNAGWLESLRHVAHEYPYTIERPEEGAYGLAVLSRLPVRESAQSPYREDGVQTAILAELDLGADSATVVLSHLMAPTSPSNSRLRNRQLVTLAAMLRVRRVNKALLFGDLNITPWSPHYAVVEAGTGLRNAARGNGYRPTWPTRPAILRIPIDHVLLSADFAVQRIRTGRDIGSDHLPLIVDLLVAAPGPR